MDVEIVLRETGERIVVEVVEEDASVGWLCEKVREHVVALSPTTDENAFEIRMAGVDGCVLDVDERVADVDVSGGVHATQHRSYPVVPAPDCIATKQGVTYALGISPCGKMLLVQSVCTIIVYSTETLKEFASMNYIAGKDGWNIAQICVSDVHAFVQGTGHIAVFDLKRFEQMTPLRGHHTKAVTGLAVSPVTNKLFSTSGEGRVEVWGLDTLCHAQSVALAAKDIAVTDTAYGERLVCATMRGVVVSDTLTLTVLATLTQPWVRMVFAYGGLVIATSQSSVIWNLSTMEKTDSTRSPLCGKPAISTCGQYMYTSDTEHRTEVTVRSIATQEVLDVIELDTPWSLQAMVMSPCGRYVYFCMRYGSVYVRHAYGVDA